MKDLRNLVFILIFLSSNISLVSAENGVTKNQAPEISVEVIIISPPESVPATFIEGKDILLLGNT